jgi:hypothetical protein
MKESKLPFIKKQIPLLHNCGLLDLKNNVLFSDEFTTYFYDILSNKAFLKHESRELLRHELHCDFCSPNRGCNRIHKRRVKNWKSFRKTQYK